MMTKARKAPEGAKPSYETISARLEKVEAELRAARDRNHEVIRKNASLHFRLRDAETAVKVMSGIIADMSGPHPAEEYIPF